jgi:hypothetical protein
MQPRNLWGMTIAAGLLMVFALGGCASSGKLEQPAATSHMKSAVGTQDELSPLAPAEARNIRKVGNHWLCEINGRTMVYNAAAGSWQPQQPGK